MKAKLKMLIRATHITEGGGLTHLNKMIKWFGVLAPENEFTLIGKIGQEDILIDPPENFKYEFHKAPSLHRAARMIWERYSLPQIVEKSGCDLLFEPGNCSPIPVSLPRVTLIHNIAPFAKEYVSEESIFQRIRLNALRKITEKSLSVSDGVIFLSRYCEEFFSKYINTSRTRTTVIYHGRPEDSDQEARVSDRAKLNSLEISGEYVLSVSHIYRYKKIREMVKGYLLALEKDNNTPSLIIAGHNYDEDYMSSIRKIISESNFSDKIMFVGSVDNKTLQTLYRNCSGFVFSSSLETCSVILIEALANGCAMACSDRSVIPEICEDAAIYFDPDNPGAIGDCILKLVNDSNLNRDLRMKARKRSKSFDWDIAAQKTLQFFDEVAGVTHSPITLEEKF
ncbi:MAG: glycosyltransferase family 4 protein [candidate division Zixibacteria bacterium]|nr:glycosyltransferase family 4 protein [candidate division Zixibacteria bacterium]